MKAIWRAGADRGAFRVHLVRTTDRSLSRRAVGDSAAGVLRVRLVVLARAAQIPAGDDAAHRRHRRVRGAAVQHDGPYRRLARRGRAGPAVDRAAHHAAAAGRRADRQHRRRGAAIGDQAAGAGRQLPDAAALELPSADARAEHGVLSGRVRRPHRHQGDADGARRARRVDRRGRAPGVRDHLFRDDAGRAGRLRRSGCSRRSSAGSRCTSRRSPISCRGWAGSRAPRPTRAR